VGAKAALYYHFHSKDDLLQALVTPVIIDIDVVLDAYEATPDSPARRRRSRRAVVSGWRGSRHCWPATVSTSTTRSEPR
jgi:AcrR family transcriptional regulator